MHMSDALVSPTVGGLMIVVSAGLIAYSVAKSKNLVDDKKIPMMGVMAALIFAGQMINFTIPGTGSSGHIGGGMLLAATLGGPPAFLCISAVLLIQCFFFADGGMLALGCNIFNMGFWPIFIAYPLIFKPILKKGITKPRLMVASVISVVVALQLGAFSVVVQTLAAGVTSLPFSTFLLLMQPIHLAIGLVEGLVTGAILCFIHAARPEILDAAGSNRQIGSGVSIKKIVVILLCATVIIGGGLSLLASQYPDGLEWSIAKITGSTEMENPNGTDELQENTAVMPDYSDAAGSTGGSVTAGIVGSALTLAIAGAAGGVVYLVKRKKKGAEKEE